jgi:hypothetical protein
VIRGSRAYSDIRQSSTHGTTFDTPLVLAQKLPWYGISITYCGNKLGAAENLRNMANRQSTNRFGVDRAILKTINWKLACRRVLVDVRSDFIYAPHLSNVFRHASAELIGEVKTELDSGRFAPAPPITIDVPKSSRMQVVPRGSRGPTFSRPGGILLPKDRLLYQALADQAAPLIEKGTDRKRSYSHRLLHKSAEMFESSRASWNRMQTRLNKLSSSRKGYVIKADVANCFASVNQHTLINHLEAIAYPASLRNALDTVLVLNTAIAALVAFCRESSHQTCSGTFI